MELFRFQNPWALLALLAPLAWCVWRRFRRRRAAGVPMASTALLAGLPRSWRQRLAWLPAALYGVAWALLTVALARPQSGEGRVRDFSQGIAIEMVLDRSGSMGNPMVYGGRRTTRLEAVKSVFAEFVFGGGDLRGRDGDLLGVIAFARYPETYCPLTLDRAAVEHGLKRLEVIPQDSPENSTSIGDGLALAVARLESAEQTLAVQQRRVEAGYRIKSKVAILLTDGQNTGSYTYSIEQAGELARKHGVKIYSIAIFGRGGFLQEPDFDTSAIEAVAKATGGLFRTCDSAQGLRDIYAEIDRLEKSSVESQRYIVRRELYRPFAAAALAALLLAVLLQRTVFRRLP